MKNGFSGYTIRHWEEADAPALARYANNRRIWLNLRDAFPYPYNLSDAEAFLAQVSEQQPVTYFAIATEQAHEHG